MKKDADKKDARPKANSPLSLRLPDDLREELVTASERLGEAETTVARMSIRYGIKVLLQTLDKTAEHAA